MKLKDILKFNFRLKMRNSVKKLKGERQEEYFDNLRALHVIDPYRHLLKVMVVVLTMAVFVNIKWAVFVLSVYTFWIVLYGVTFLGVSYMYKDSLDKQDFEEDVSQKDL